MDKKKNKASRTKSSSAKPPRTGSMYEFQNRGPFLPPTPGYFPYMVSPWPVDLMYMDLVRRLSVERGLQSGQPHEGRGKRGAPRAHRGDRARPGTPAPDPRPFSPYTPHNYRPQFYQPQGQLYGEYDCWSRPPGGDSSTSSESLAPCNSCRCCRYFAESRSLLDIVGRARCGRKYVNDRLLGRKSEDGRKCGHSCGHAEPPVRERAKSKGRRGGKQGGRAGRGADEGGASEPERDRESDENSNSGREPRGGTGDERAPQLVMSVKNKPRNRSTAYFLPLSY